MAEDTGKQRGVDSLTRQKHVRAKWRWRLCRQSLNYDCVFCFSARRKQRAVVWRKEAGVGKQDWGTETDCHRVQQTDPRTMIQLPSNFSLPLWPALLHSSGRNVAQIRVSARWGGWETGKQREGKEWEREETNSSPFTQAKGLLAHLCVLLSLLGSLDSLDYKQGQAADTHTHTQVGMIGPDRRYHSTVTRWDYNMGVRQGVMKKCVSVAVKYPRPTELPR